MGNPSAKVSSVEVGRPVPHAVDHTSTPASASALDTIRARRAPPASRGANTPTASAGSAAARSSQVPPSRPKYSSRRPSSVVLGRCRKLWSTSPRKRGGGSPNGPTAKGQRGEPCSTMLRRYQIAAHHHGPAEAEGEPGGQGAQPVPRLPGADGQDRHHHGSGGRLRAEGEPGRQQRHREQRGTATRGRDQGGGAHQPGERREVGLRLVQLPHHQRGGDHRGGGQPGGQRGTPRGCAG